MRIPGYLSTFWILLLLACGTFRPTLQRYEYRQIHMGVEARIVLYASDSSHAVTAARAAFRRIGELDAVMSDYRDDSELMRLVSRPALSSVRVSDPLWRVLVAARELSRQTDGAFDVTSGPVVRLWREARRNQNYPDEQALTGARELTGWNKLKLDSPTRSVILEKPGMLLDLGGIGKGFAADEALAVLRRHGAGRALVELGGDIVVGDPPPDRNGWEIRLQDAAGAPPVVELVDAAISTSGDAVQFVELDGVRYSHVVDPRTGVALRDQFAVTVIAPTGLLSDPLATALGVLGPEAGADFMRRHHPEVTFYIRRVEPEGP